MQLFSGFLARFSTQTFGLIVFKESIVKLLSSRSTHCTDIEADDDSPVIFAGEMKCARPLRFDNPLFWIRTTAVTTRSSFAGTFGDFGTCNLGDSGGWGDFGDFMGSNNREICIRLELATVWHSEGRKHCSNLALGASEWGIPWMIKWLGRSNNIAASSEQGCAITPIIRRATHSYLRY